MHQNNYLPVLNNESESRTAKLKERAAVVGLLAVTAGGLVAAAHYGINHGSPGPLHNERSDTTTPDQPKLNIVNDNNMVSPTNTTIHHR